MEKENSKRDFGQVDDTGLNLLTVLSIVST